MTPEERNQKAREQYYREREEGIERMTVEPWMKKIDYPVLRRLCWYADISSLDQMRHADPDKIRMFGPKKVKHVEEVARQAGVLAPDEHLFRPLSASAPASNLDGIREYAQTLRNPGPGQVILELVAEVERLRAALETAGRD